MSVRRPVNSGTRRFPQQRMTPTRDSLYLPFTAGEHEGIFYYLGGGISPYGWSNPVPDKVIASASALLGGTVAELTNRASSDVVTTDVANSWYRWDLPVPVKPDAWEVRHRNFFANSNLAGTCKLQGSNDGSTWDDLATTTFTGLRDTYEAETCSASTWYRSVRVYQSGVGSTRPEGDDYLCLGEFELYGWVMV